MRRGHRISGLWLGILGALVLLAFSYGAFTKKVPLLDGYQIEVQFKSSNQLRKGSPVRIAGVDVGKVTGFEDGPGTTRYVRMKIGDKGRPIHSDAQFKIRPRLFLEGGFLVEIRPGSPSAPELENGDRVPVAQTQTPVQFHQVLTALNRRTRDGFKVLLKELSTALDGGGAEALAAANKPFAPALRDTSRIAEAARGTEAGDLRRLLQSSARVTETLAEREQALADGVTNLHRTTRALASESVALRAGLREFDGTLQEAPAALDALDRALPPTETLTAAVRPSLRALPPVLDKTDKLLVQLQGLTRRSELPGLVDALGPTLRELPRLERRLLQLFPLITPVTDCVRDKALPVLNAEVPDGALSTGQPVWQELIHGTVGLNSANQNFDGNGHTIRYLFGAGLQQLELVVPGIGELVGNVSGSLQGTNPRWLGSRVRAPMRFDQRCVDQPVADLKARTGSPVTAVRSVRRKPTVKVGVKQVREAITAQRKFERERAR